MGIRNFIDQTFPPSAIFTERNLPLQNGKVFFITGANSGVGFELTKLLYLKGATIYLGCRSSSKTESAIKSITSLSTNNPGVLKYIPLDLADLSTIAPAVSSFGKQESKIDVLFNNGGIGSPPPNAETKQGHDLLMGTNCLGPFLLTQLLLPYLRKSSYASAAGSTRVVWTSSLLVDTDAPPGGMDFSTLTPPMTFERPTRTYAMSKTGNLFLASQLQLKEKEGGSGITSLTINPGTLNTAIWVPVSWALKLPLRLLMSEAKYGAYTALFAGLGDWSASDEGFRDSGGYVIPFGRWHSCPREDILAALRNVEEGGTGAAKRFWEWCEEMTAPFV